MVGDHDFSRGSLVPSVALNIQIPTKASESFYTGEVTMTLKDGVFQPSDPNRHAAETKKMLIRKYGVGNTPPVLMIYTDGGPDHR